VSDVYHVVHYLGWQYVQNWRVLLRTRGVPESLSFQWLLFRLYKYYSRIPHGNKRMTIREFTSPSVKYPQN